MTLSANNKSGKPNKIVAEQPVSPLVDIGIRVLKHEDTFAIFDAFGDVDVSGGIHGLYESGTRFLSRYELMIDNRRPSLLSSSVNHNGTLLKVDLTNPVIFNNNTSLPQGILHVLRIKFLWDSGCHERIRVCNYGSENINTLLSISLDADFADIFEIRGTKRKRWGSRAEPEANNRQLLFSYKGLDGIQRNTRIQTEPEATRIISDRIDFELSLGPKEEKDLDIATRCETDKIENKRSFASFDHSWERAKQFWSSRGHNHCEIETINEQANDWISRSQTDLNLMTTRTQHGLYPYAGVPWFNTVFGRDGIITALQALWIDADIARGVLMYLASTQSYEDDPERDAEPGKILHEVRQGEMAATGQIPFQLYYGSVDSTPLFIILAGAYYEHTADRVFIEHIWPNIERGLAWIDRYGDSDGDGFVEYFQRSQKGLKNQGWKDSHDCISHADGRLAEGPIALCEVQGYVYQAKLKAAHMADMLGDTTHAARLKAEAFQLRERFERSFWCEELKTYALALDGHKQQCRVSTSNAGQCLFSGIASPDHARDVAMTLLGETMYSGWGIRTLGSNEVRYNPMSYHNGSVWPHDNALIAEGMSRYGIKDCSEKILNSLIEAALHMDFQRLPELFCGFRRRVHVGPTHYPVACSPQAWAAGATFMLLKAALGLAIDAENRLLKFHYPRLPANFRDVRISNLRVGRHTVDLMLRSHPEDIGINVLRKTGPVDVVVMK
ncbi:MAG TPA: amylo-alpha-1,6-glucosidase [Gammaproteobacteria bacterium]